MPDRGHTQPPETAWRPNAPAEGLLWGRNEAVPSRGPRKSQDQDEDEAPRGAARYAHDLPGPSAGSPLQDAADAQMSAYPRTSRLAPGVPV